MKSRLEEDLKLGGLEAVVLDKFLIDTFKPKLCREEDVLVVAFLVRHGSSAVELGEYINRGPFTFINVESASSPDSDGYYVVIAEMDRGPEMFNQIDLLLQYISQKARIEKWHFKSDRADKFVAWNQENFQRTVPQHPQAFFDGKDRPGGAATAADAPSATVNPTSGKQRSAAARDSKAAAGFDYRILAKIIQQQITRANLLFVREVQKQFGKVIEDNRVILSSFKELKYDQRYLYKQLEMHQKREKLALLREQQDIKRIRDLEDRLSYLVFSPAQAQNVAGDAAIADAMPLNPVRTDDGALDAWESPSLATVETTPDPVPQTRAPSSMAAADPSTERQRWESQAPTDDSGDDGAAVPPVESDPVAEYFSLAMAASERKDYHTAVEYFTRITDLAPHEPRSYYNLAILYYRLQDHETAHEYAKRALELGAGAARRILEKVETRKDRPRDVPGSGAAADPLVEPAEDAHRSTDAADRPAGDAGKRTTGGKAAALVESEPDAEVTDTGAPTKISGSTPDTGSPPGLTGEIEEFLGGTETVSIDGFESTPDYAPSSMAIGEDVSAETPGDDQAGPLGGHDADIGTPAADATGWEADGDSFQAMDPEPIAAAAASEPDETPMTPAAVDAFPETESAENAQSMPVDDSTDEAMVPPPVPAFAEELPEDSWIEPPPLADTRAAAGQVLEPESAFETAEPMPEDMAAEMAATLAALAGEEAATEEPYRTTAPPVPDDAQSEPAATEADPAGRLFESGMAASDRGDYPAAIDHFNRFIDLLPGEPRGYYNLAILYYRIRDYDAAQACAEQALELGAGAARRILEKIQRRRNRLQQEKIAVAGASDEPAVEAGIEAALPADESGGQTVAERELYQSTETDNPLWAASGDSPDPAVDAIPAESNDEQPTVTTSDEVPEFPVMSVAMDGEPEVDAPSKPQIPPMVAVTEIDLPRVETEGPMWDEENALTAQPGEEAAVPSAAAAAGADQQTAMGPVAAAGPEPVAADGPEPEQPAPAPLPDIGGATDPAPAADAVAAVAAAPETVSTDVRAAISEKGPPTQPERRSGDKPPIEGATDLDPAGTCFAAGMAASDRGDYLIAIDHFKQFLALLPDEPRGFYNLAILYYRLKDYALARKHARRAVDLGSVAARRILKRIDERTAKTAAPDDRDRPDQPDYPGERKPAGAAAGIRPSKDRPPPNSASADARPALSGAAQIDDNTIIWDADDMEDEPESQADMIDEFSGFPVDQGEVIVFEQSSAFETIQGGKRPAGGERRSDPEQTAESGTEPSRASAAAGEEHKTAGTPGKAPPAADVEQIKKIFALGQAAADKQQYLKAIQYFTKVTSLAPNDPRGYYNLAVVSYRLKFYETAREHARRALALGAKPAKRILEKIEARRAA